jgi:transcription elongation factor Elf1
MPISKIVRSYKLPEDVDIWFKCPECETNQTIRLGSHVKKYNAFCKVCETINEIEIIVCPECNSSKYVRNTNSAPTSGDYYRWYKCVECDIDF